MNNFKKYYEAYLNILFESNIDFKKKCRHIFTFNELCKAFDNIKYLNDSDNKIILEAPGTLEYPNSLMKFFETCDDFTNVTYNEILCYLDKDWKYYELMNNINLNINLMIFKEDFSNEIKIKDIFKYFTLAINDDDKIKLFNKINFNEIKKSYGLYIPLNETHKAIVLNKQKYSKITILHEFTHLLQDVLYVEKTNIKDHYDLTEIDFLNISSNVKAELIRIINDEDEIIPYINEFCETIVKMYKSFYSNEDSTIFFNFVIDNILVKTKIDEDFMLQYKCVCTDLMPMYVFITCWIYNIDFKKFEMCLKKDLMTSKFKK